MLLMVQDPSPHLISPAVAGMVFDVGVSFSSSFPLSLPPASLEVWMGLAEEGALQASILDGLGVASPAVPVGPFIPPSQPTDTWALASVEGGRTLSLRRTEGLG